MKNSTTQLRITSEMKKEIKEISKATGFKEVDLVTHLLNRSLEQLKSDKIEAGGYERLEFTIRK